MKQDNSLLSFINNNETRAIAFQVITLLIIAFVFYSGISNLMFNIEAREIHTGFAFLSNRAGFDINESMIAYTPEHSNLRVFYVGLINTLVIAVVGIIFATIIGLIIGIARLSNNWLISKLATGYIELFRNIPILIQILIWYNMALLTLPSPKGSFNFFDSIFINKRGVYVPEPVIETGFVWVLIAVVLGIVLAFLLKRHFKQKHDKTGVYTRTVGYSIGLIFGLPLVVFFLLGSPLHFDYPTLTGFNFQGGRTFSPEFLALAVALSVYTATYIAEAIRSGIEAVDKGQKEAAAALGLTQTQSLKLVVLPQALRVAIPPTINQYLNLTKNSSLATAIGYPELMSAFGGTVLNQVGQAVEILGMTMAVYLVISLFISLLLNIVNKKMSIKGR
ncbi:MAG: amino acid ABC transporter permease [Gammaproteobacteria bacterium]|nr:amino acid ABC transporter permease [Gammaproteobacteria bacterium]